MEKLYKPFIVWERHVLSDKELGQVKGDVPHQFNTEKDARAFIRAASILQPFCNPGCLFREIHFSDYCHGIDFGSWCDFFVLESRDEDCRLR